MLHNAVEYYIILVEYYTVNIEDRLSPMSLELSSPMPILQAGSLGFRV